jgi:hypothetical protein
MANKFFQPSLNLLEMTVAAPMCPALSRGVSRSGCPTNEPTRIKFKLLWLIWVCASNMKCNFQSWHYGTSGRHLQPLAGRRALTRSCLRLHICCSQRWFRFEALCSRPVSESEMEIGKLLISTSESELSSPQDVCHKFPQLAPRTSQNHSRYQLLTMISFPRILFSFLAYISVSQPF